jgi:arylsulfatase
VKSDLDGTDLSPVLLGDGALEPRDLYWIWNSRTNRWALRYDDWKIVHYGSDQPQTVSDWQLFNLKQDPRERRDVAAAHPEQVAQLHRMFLKQRRKDQASR